MPVRLIEALPVLLLGLAGLAWIAGRRMSLGRAGGARASPPAAIWAWPGPGRVVVRRLGALRCVQLDRGARSQHLAGGSFDVPAIGAIALLGAWLLSRAAAGRARALTAAVVLVLAGLGVWSFVAMRAAPMGGPAHWGAPYDQVSSICIYASFRVPAGHDVLNAIAMAGTSANVPVS